MNTSELARLLTDVQRGHVDIGAASERILHALRAAPFEDLGFARVTEDGRSGLALSDFFDFGIYVDAATTDIRTWYVERFLRLRETAFADPASYFRQYAELTPDEARETALEIWDTINGPNLVQNILPTRGRATLVLEKGPDHAVRRVRLRKQ